MTLAAPAVFEPVKVQETKVAVRVCMLDLLSIVPYYTSELSAALSRRGDVRLDLGAITYYLDRDCFARPELSFAPGLLDIVGRCPGLTRALRRVFKTAEYMVNLASLWMRVRRFDVLHVQFLPLVLFRSSLEVRFLESVQRKGVKVLYTVHNVLPHDASPSLRAHYAKIYRLADHLICHDPCARAKLIEEFGVAPKRISVIAHGRLLASDKGVPDTRAAVRRRLGVSDDACLVLWQGILRRYKGVDFLLDAWSRVGDKSARLAIVGGGDETIEREICEKVAALGLNDSVSLDLRFVSVQELQAYHAAADILVYPYQEVTTSGALMTGIGYGKAIVASRLPAFEQVLRHDHNALLADFGDTAEWSLQLERLIGDVRLRNRLGSSLVDAQNWDDIAAETAVCYRSLLHLGSDVR